MLRTIFLVVAAVVWVESVSAGGRTGCGLDSTHECNDFSGCTIDSYDPGHPNADPQGCVNIDLNGQPCVPGPEGCAFCQSAGNIGASCHPDFAVCDCPVGGGSWSPQLANSLCARERLFSLENSLGDCDCGEHCSNNPGANQCSWHNDPFPMAGGHCLYTACYEPGQPVVVDVEVSLIVDDVCSGEPWYGCGAELFLQWDTDKLDLVDLTPNPDGWFEWPDTSFLIIDDVTGTIDLGVGVMPAASCTPKSGGSHLGGRIVRLTFNSLSTGPTTGVQFRPHVPPSRILGPNGPLPIHGCDGNAEPDGTQAMVIADDCATVGPAVPTVSQWGVAATMILIATAGTLVFAGRADRRLTPKGKR